MDKLYKGEYEEYKGVQHYVFINQHGWSFENFVQNWMAIDEKGELGPVKGA